MFSNPQLAFVSCDYFVNTKSDYLLMYLTCVARMNACRSTSGDVTSVETDEKTEALLCVLPSNNSRLVSSLRRLFSL